MRPGRNGSDSRFGIPPATARSCSRCGSMSGPQHRTAELLVCDSIRVMTTRPVLLATALCMFAIASGSADSLPRLKVSDNKRFLVTADGRPFFWLADTAWELLHRLNREDAERYLKNRAERRFNVIQAVVLAERDGLVEPNPYGHTPLRNNDLTQPVEEYFAHVDWIVARANALGIYIGMLPTWGDKWNRKGRGGPEIFTPDSAERFGEWLGRRYKDAGII